MKTIIIGGGAAAMTCASKLRRNDSDLEIVVYQKADYVSLGACGIPYFLAADFSVEKLIARTAESFLKQEIQLHLNSTVVGVDFFKKSLVIKNNKTGFITTDHYETLVIATGARPLVPKLKNQHLKNIFTVTSKEDAIAIKEKITSHQKVAIIGAGFIGLELVETFKKLQQEIILIEAKERVISNAFDIEITTVIEQYLLDSGIQLHLSKKVVGFQGEDKVSGIVFENDESIAVDLVILALGFIPNTDIFQNSQLAMLKNGAIIIDNQGKTKIDNVYSAGDCATINKMLITEPNYMPLATTAIKMAKVVANNITYKNDQLTPTLGSAILRINELQVARTGLSEWEAKDKFEYQTIIIDDYDLPSYMSDSRPLKLKLIYDIVTTKLLGAQMLGYNQAVLRINTLAAAISKQMTLSELANLDLAYAPPFSRTSDIMHIAASKIKTKIKE